MWINPPLEIVPNKFSLSKSAKNYSDQILRDYWGFLNKQFKFLEIYLNLTVYCQEVISLA